MSFVSLPGQGLDNTYMSYRVFVVPQHASHPCVEGLWPICELQQVSPILGGSFAERAAAGALSR